MPIYYIDSRVYLYINVYKCSFQICIDVQLQYCGLQLCDDILYNKLKVVFGLIAVGLCCRTIGSRSPWRLTGASDFEQWLGASAQQIVL